MPGMMAISMPNSSTPAPDGKADTGSGYGGSHGAEEAGGGKKHIRKQRRGSLRNLQYQKDKADGKAGAPTGSRGIRRSASLPLTSPPPLHSPVALSPPPLSLSNSDDADEQILNGFDQDPTADQELGGFGKQLSPRSTMTALTTSRAQRTVLHGRRETPSFFSLLKMFSNCNSTIPTINRGC